MPLEESSKRFSEGEEQMVSLEVTAQEKLDDLAKITNVREEDQLRWKHKQMVLQEKATEERHVAMEIASRSASAE